MNRQTVSAANSPETPRWFAKASVATSLAIIMITPNSSAALRRYYVDQPSETQGAMVLKIVHPASGVGSLLADGNKASLDTLRDDALNVKSAIHGLQNKPKRPYDHTVLPSTATIEFATEWIAKLYSDAAASGQQWIEPNVTTGSDGEVVLEWWHRGQKLTVYISDGNAEYIQVMGSKIDSEIVDGDAMTSEVRQKLWSWLARS